MTERPPARVWFSKAPPCCSFGKRLLDLPESDSGMDDVYGFIHRTKVKVVLLHIDRAEFLEDRLGRRFFGFTFQDDGLIGSAGAQNAIRVFREVTSLDGPCAGTEVEGGADPNTPYGHHVRASVAAHGR